MGECCATFNPQPPAEKKNQPPFRTRPEGNAGFRLTAKPRQLFSNR
jgi:hypothetical protein